MQTALEYISAGIILALILGVTGQYATNMVSDKVANIEQTTGMQLADKIIDTILLSPGSPSNWGTSINPPNNMGFALANAIKPYQLEREKIKCLYNDSSNYIPAYQIRDIIGLSQNYYISLEVYPIYTISIHDITNEKFSINVVNQWGIPVSTVKVKGAYSDIENITSYTLATFMSDNLQNAVIKSNMTDVNGNCVLNFPGSGTKKSLIVMAEQLNVKSINTWPVASKDLINKVESTVGISTDFNVELVYRSVEIDGLNYFFKLKMWWS
jgi:hypothetical protein